MDTWAGIGGLTPQAQDESSAQIQVPDEMLTPPRGGGPAGTIAAVLGGLTLGTLGLVAFVPKVALAGAWFVGLTGLGAKIRRDRLLRELARDDLIQVERTWSRRSTLEDRPGVIIALTARPEILALGKSVTMFVRVLSDGKYVDAKDPDYQGDVGEIRCRTIRKVPGGGEGRPPEFPIGVFLPDECVRAPITERKVVFEAEIELRVGTSVLTLGALRIPVETKPPPPPPPPVPPPPPPIPEAYLSLPPEERSLTSAPPLAENVPPPPPLPPEVSTEAPLPPAPEPPPEEASVASEPGTSPQSSSFPIPPPPPPTSSEAASKPVTVASGTSSRFPIPPPPDAAVGVASHPPEEHPAALDPAPREVPEAMTEDLEMESGAGVPIAPPIAASPVGGGDALREYAPLVGAVIGGLLVLGGGGAALVGLGVPALAGAGLGLVLSALGSGVAYRDRRARTRNQYLVLQATTAEATSREDVEGIVVGVVVMPTDEGRGKALDMEIRLRDEGFYVPAWDLEFADESGMVFVRNTGSLPGPDAEGEGETSLEVFLPISALDLPPSPYSFRRRSVEVSVKVEGLVLHPPLFEVSFLAETKSARVDELDAEGAETPPPDTSSVPPLPEESAPSSASEPPPPDSLPGAAALLAAASEFQAPEDLEADEDDPEPSGPGADEAMAPLLEQGPLTAAEVQRGALQKSLGAASPFALYALHAVAVGQAEPITAGVALLVLGILAYFLFDLLGAPDGKVVGSSPALQLVHVWREVTTVRNRRGITVVAGVRPVDVPAGEPIEMRIRLRDENRRMMEGALEAFTGENGIFEISKMAALVPEPGGTGVGRLGIFFPLRGIALKVRNPRMGLVVEMVLSVGGKPVCIHELDLEVELLPGDVRVADEPEVDPGSACGLCAEELTDDRVACVECGLRQHTECHEHTRRCAASGCRGTCRPEFGGER